MKIAILQTTSVSCQMSNLQIQKRRQITANYDIHNCILYTSFYFTLSTLDLNQILLHHRYSVLGNGLPKISG
jgi:hypothetical protein